MNMPIVRTTAKQLSVAAQALSAYVENGTVLREPDQIRSSIDDLRYFLKKLENAVDDVGV
jgi:hypothetical protein